MPATPGPTGIAPEDRASDALRASACLFPGMVVAYGATWLIAHPVGALIVGDAVGEEAMGAVLLAVVVLLPIGLAVLSVCCYVAWRLIQRKVTAILWLVGAGWALLLLLLT